MPTLKEVSAPTSDLVHTHGQNKYVNELIITESKTKHGRAFSFFRNLDSSGMQHTVRPRRNVHPLEGNLNAYRGQNSFINHTPIFHLGNVDKPVNKYSDEEKIHNSPEKKVSIFRSIWNKFDTYCDKSTLHGLRYIGDNTLSTPERVFWLLAFFSAIAFGAYFITSIYQKFNNNPVIVSFSPYLVTIDKIPFPAITICNVNIALKSQAQRINEYGSEVDKKLLADMCNMNSSFPNETDSSAETADWGTVRRFIISINQKCSAMIKYCKWGNEIISCDEYINSILTDEGYCCSFNRLPLNYSLRDTSTDDTRETYPETRVDWNPEDGYPKNTPPDTYPMRSLGAGTHLGLTVVLDADLKQYYCTSTNSIGFKVLLSNPIERPKVADVGFLLTPGDETRITINPIIEESTPGLRNIDLEKRQCFFARERYLQFYRLYSERNCRLECQANYTLEKCGCVPYFLPKNMTTKICDKNTEYCANEAKVVIEQFSRERKACRCLPGCFELNYEKKSASTGKIAKKYNSTVNGEYMQNVTFDYFAEHMAVVHFFFDKDKFSKQVKSELYGFSEFLSNTGGLLGLFLGFSFLSAVEIFYYIFLKTTCNMYHERKKKKTTEHVNYQKQVAAMPFMK